MAAKTTSGSGFDFGFVFYAPDLVENKSNLENFAGALFEIFGSKLRNLKIILKSYANFELGDF